MTIKLSEKLALSHIGGVKLFPVMMKNRDTGTVAYRLSKSGNTKSDSIEVVDENDMILKVTEQGYAVRARTIAPSSQGGIAGLYKLNQRSIRCYSLSH